MKKLLFSAITAVIVFTAIITAGAYNIGDTVGHALKTDIVATINGYDIPSYNINNQTYIIAEDLRYYGFSVNFDNSARALGITRDYTQSWAGKAYAKPPVAEKQIGVPEFNLLYTDIATYLDGYYTPSCNINGQTIIRFSDLKKYGELTFNAETREAALVIGGLNQNPLSHYINGTGVLLSQQNEKTYNDMGYKITCNVRPCGNSIVFGYLFDDYMNTDDATKQAMKHTAEQYILQYKASLSLYKMVPSVTSIIFNYYEGDGDLITSVSANL